MDNEGGCNSILQKFRTIVGDLNQDDDTLLRFLKARDMDLRKAEDMLRKSVAWRNENNISSYINWTRPQPLQDGCIYKFTGYDNDGCPVLWTPMGCWNVRELVEKGFKEDLIKATYLLLEEIMHEIKKSNEKQFVMIIGQEEQSYWKVAHYETSQVWYAAFTEFEANYPEILKICYVVNAPWIFSWIFNFFKPILSSKTVSKVQIFGSDQSKWLPVLLSNMPRESIPSKYLNE